MSASIKSVNERRGAHNKYLGQVMDLHGDGCHLCGKSGADSLDHLVPYSWGGSNHPDNLRPAHLRCNSKKGNRHAHAGGLFRTAQGTYEYSNEEGTWHTTITGHRIRSNGERDPNVVRLESEREAKAREAAAKWKEEQRLLLAKANKKWKKMTRQDRVDLLPLELMRFREERVRIKVFHARTFWTLTVLNVLATLFFMTKIPIGWPLLIGGALEYVIAGVCNAYRHETRPSDSHKTDSYRRLDEWVKNKFDGRLGDAFSQAEWSEFYQARFDEAPPERKSPWFEDYQRRRRPYYRPYRGRRYYRGRGYRGRRW